VQKKLKKKLLKDHKQKPQELQQEQRPNNPEQSQETNADVAAETVSDAAGATTMMDAPMSDATTVFEIPKGHSTQHALVNAIDKCGFCI